MTSDLDIGGESATELRRRRVFRVRIWVGTGCFLLASFIPHLWGGLSGSGPWRVLWALLPLIPVVWMVIVIVLRVRQMDEYQVKLFFPGLTVGFLVAMVTALVMASLAAAGLHNLPNAGWAVVLFGTVSWAVTHILVGAPKG